MRNTKKGPTAKMGATAAQDATVRFEVFHNGRRIARSGIPGYGVLSTGASWVLRDVRRFPPGAGVDAQKFHFNVGGLDSSDPDWSRHVDWVTPTLKVGDRIEIRITDDPRVDPPAREHKYRNQQRPEPPPPTDPARMEIQGAILWPAPAGVYLRALDGDSGGPVTLAPSDALRMARALTKLAGGSGAPARRRRKEHQRR